MSARMPLKEKREIMFLVQEGDIQLLSWFLSRVAEGLNTAVKTRVLVEDVRLDHRLSKTAFVLDWTEVNSETSVRAVDHAGYRTLVGSLFFNAVLRLEMQYGWSDAAVHSTTRKTHWRWRSPDSSSELAARSVDSSTLCPVSHRQNTSP